MSPGLMFVLFVAALVVAALLFLRPATRSGMDSDRDARRSPRTGRERGRR